MERMKVQMGEQGQAARSEMEVMKASYEEQMRRMRDDLRAASDEEQRASLKQQEAALKAEQDTKMREMEERAKQAAVQQAQVFGTAAAPAANPAAHPVLTALAPAAVFVRSWPSPRLGQWCWWWWRSCCLCPSWWSGSSDGDLKGQFVCDVVHGRGEPLVVLTSSAILVSAVVSASSVIFACVSAVTIVDC